jgi:ATP-dependent RNA helicase DeaD
VLPVYGGQSYGPQLAALRRGVHIVVGTPGRIMDHLDKGTLQLSGVRFLVLDEADEMLSMGFAEDVETILASTPEGKNVALFSATMPGAIRRLAARYLHDPLEITMKSKTTTSPNTTQRYLVVSYPQKLEALTRILEVETFDAMIVFVRTKNETETVAEKLRARGFSAQAINGDMGQPQRERTVSQLKDGSLDILVATDVAARGLDVDRISHVVNFDIPTDTESYVHRIGRTGRAGRSGQAISFVTPRERYLLKVIEKATGQPLTQIHMPTVEAINSSRLARFDAAITEALGSSDLEFYRDVVGHYAQEYDVAESDVAAALAVVLQGDKPLLLDDEPEPARQPDEWMTYRIAVGRRHKVQPGAIVATLTKAGGLKRRDVGRIDIKSDHCLVQLPGTLSGDQLKKLRKAEISGQPLDTRPDTGPPGRHRAKPRHKGGKKRP